MSIGFGDGGLFVLFGAFLVLAFFVVVAFFLGCCYFYFSMVAERLRKRAIRKEETFTIYVFNRRSYRIANLIRPWCQFMLLSWVYFRAKQGVFMLPSSEGCYRAKRGVGDNSCGMGMVAS
jgi:hypothetical protein